MYSYEQVYQGISKYLDNEIINKVGGWQKWILGAGLSMALNNSTKIFNDLKHNGIVRMLNLIDENDHINVVDAYKHLREQAHKGAVTFEIPVVGAITLNQDDVDKLYRYIIED